MLLSVVNGACPRLLAGYVALGSEASIKRIVLCPRNRLFNKGKIVVKDFLSSRTSSHDCSAMPP